MRGPTFGILAFTLPLVLLTSPAHAQEAPSEQATVEAQFVDLINADRAKLGLAPLTVAPELVAVGRQWSAAMGLRDQGSNPCFVNHNPRLSSQVSSPWQGLAENVGCGAVDVESLHAKFMNSPGHYRNIVNPAYDAIGVGVVFEGEVVYVTQQFIDVREVPAAAVNPTVAPTRKPVVKTSAKRVKK